MSRFSNIQINLIANQGARRRYNSTLYKAVGLILRDAKMMTTNMQFLQAEPVKIPTNVIVADSDDDNTVQQHT